MLDTRFSPISPLPSQLLEKEVYTVLARRATRGGDIGVNGGLSAGILLARVCVIDPGGELWICAGYLEEAEPATIKPPISKN